VTATQEAKECAEIAAQAAADKLATNIVAIDVSSHLPFADIFIICSANNEPQLRAVIDNVEEKLLKAGHKRLHREGSGADDWVLIGFPDVVVHAFLKEARDYYRLENLWSDCPQIALPVLAGEPS
jgi:ribosome-associated protein